ncbi:MAG: hypothetical protein Q9167_003031 [Letrouitia subvulpina]
MPSQVLRSRYIDRKKLVTLLNGLYEKAEFSITLRLDNWIIDIPKPLTEVDPISDAITGDDRFWPTVATKRKLPLGLPLPFLHSQIHEEKIINMDWHRRNKSTYVSDINRFHFNPKVKTVFQCHQYTVRIPALGYPSMLRV